MITPENLVNCLLWTGFRWTNYSSDTSADYVSYWQYFYGFKLNDLIISTTNYTSNNSIEYVDCPQDIFLDNDVIFVAKKGDDEFIETKNFALFLNFIANFINLREKECFPMYNLLEKDVISFFQIEECDADKIFIYNKKYRLINTQENLDLLNICFINYQKIIKSCEKA